MSDSLRIAIIGGGPGGLTLARVLFQNGIESAVFELDGHPMARPQGGTLDLHPDSGQVAIRHAGLTKEFAKVARYEDQEMRLYDKMGNLRLENTDIENNDRPEVDRGALRHILLASLPEGVVRWGHKLRTVEPQADGTYTVTFENGVSGVYDPVVGADGAWSKVRPLVSGATPAYTGVSFVDLGIDNVDADHPEIARLVGHGSMFALGDSKALIAQRNAGAHIRVYAGFRVPEEWATNGDFNLSSPAAARSDLLRHYEGWAPSLLELIRKCNDRIVARQLYALPVGHRWKNRPGVTLLGDAAHLMSPFSGQGVNNAMLDATELALALAEEDDWVAAVKRYEAVMLDRAEEAATASAMGLERTIAPNGLEHTLDWLRHIVARKETNHG